jgi:error-prone DNA polymerase
MGFYAPAQLVRDARAHGVRVLPVDVNASGWHAGVEVAVKMAAAPAVRLGLEQVYGLGEAAGRRIEEARRGGRFRLVRELARRARLDRESLLHLARAGALASLGLDRRRAIWEAMQSLDRPGRLPLLESLSESHDEHDEHDEHDGGHQDGHRREEPHEHGCRPAATAGGPAGTVGSLGDPDDGGGWLPAMSPREEVVADYRTSGLSLAAHPLSFERERLAATGVDTVAATMAAPEGRRVAVAGIVLTRQRPGTAKGIIFLTIEDETGAANVVVRPEVWHAADQEARRAAVLVVHGRIQRRGRVVHVLAMRITAVPVASLPRMSRDFH